MKTWAALIVAFFLGIWFASGGWGWGEIVYMVLVLFGFITLIFIAALILAYMEKPKPTADEQRDAVDKQRDVI